MRNNIEINSEDANHMISRLYRRFNQLICVLRPRVNCNVLQIDRPELDKKILDFEILLDEVRELTR